jgi:hypothetical protein
VYADWLDERGEAENGEYLRLVAAEQPDYPRMIEAGARVDGVWREAVASRFEVVYRYRTAPQNWRWDINYVLSSDLRTGPRDLTPLHESVPAVVADGHTPEAAVEAADDLMRRTMRQIEGPRNLVVSENFMPNAEVLRVQLGDSPEPWFVPRRMGSLEPPIPTRFAVALGVGFNYQSLQSDQFAVVYIEPLRALFGVAEDDARHLLYAGGELPLAGSLSFDAAFRWRKQLKGALKRHSLSQVLREFITLEIRPEVPPPNAP